MQVSQIEGFFMSGTGQMTPQEKITLEKVRGNAYDPDCVWLEESANTPEFIDEMLKVLPHNRSVRNVSLTMDANEERAALVRDLLQSKHTRLRSLEWQIPAGISEEVGAALAEGLAANRTLARFKLSALGTYNRPKVGKQLMDAVLEGGNPNICDMILPDSGANRADIDAVTLENKRIAVDLAQKIQSAQPLTVEELKTIEQRLPAILTLSVRQHVDFPDTSAHLNPICSDDIRHVLKEAERLHVEIALPKRFLPLSMQDMVPDAKPAMEEPAAPFAQRVQHDRFEKLRRPENFRHGI
jgi:hypothetical protein